MLTLKTLLNKVEKFKGFVYTKIYFGFIKKKEVILIEVEPRKNKRGLCSVCYSPSPTYDTGKVRYFAFVPLWNIPVYFVYRRRRVSCQKHGINVEHLPWANGSEQLTHTFKSFLAGWAKKLSWKECAESFHSSWDMVAKSVKWVVEQGLRDRCLEHIQAIAIDEIAIFKGHKYLTCIYQIDQGMKRLLWCGKGRTSKSLLGFFRRCLGAEKSQNLNWVCTDMWQAYLRVIARKAPQALNILDRFHIMKKFNEAIDKTRQEEQMLDKCAKEKLKGARWSLLKNKENQTAKQVEKMSDLLKTNLKTVKAYLLKVDFNRFWTYENKEEAEQFLTEWCIRTNKTKLHHMKKVAKMLDKKKELILNWFEANPRLSSGIAEGFNNKAKLVIKKAYGFRTLEHLKTVLYHNMGDLPMPKSTHKFF